MNPLRFMSGTYCAACHSFDLAENFRWSDTNESVGHFRRRLFNGTPLYVKLVMFLVIPVACGALACLVVPLIPAHPNANPIVLSILAAGVGVLVGGIAMALTPLSGLVARLCGVNFRAFR
ncbi:MAG: hypothetical protein RIC55_29785 [Pirellulaceae bacterium]